MFPLLFNNQEGKNSIARKDEKKPADKEVYRLWWEYLKRSKKYKIYCDAVRKVMIDAYKKKGEEYLRKIERLILKHTPQKENKVIRQLFVSNYPVDELNDSRVLAEVKNMEENWSTFRNVFVGSFDDWWKTQEKMDFSVPMVVLNDPDAIKKLPYFLKKCTELKKEGGNNPNPQEVIETLIEEEYEYLFIAVPMVGNVTMDDISKEISDVRARWRKDQDFVSADYRFRRFFMPVSRIRFDELKRYLKVYDLKQQGLTIKEIIAELDPFKKCNDGDVQRVFRSDLQKAKKIIGNVESGFFPERPPYISQQQDK
jgi:hypothetical protein